MDALRLGHFPRMRRRKALLDGSVCTGGEGMGNGSHWRQKECLLLKDLTKGSWNVDVRAGGPG